MVTLPADDVETLTTEQLRARMRMLDAFQNTLLDRANWFRQAGITFDGKRDMWKLMGYDDVVTTKQYRDEYARGGIAKRIVEAYPKATWRGGVEVFEDEENDTNTTFEQAFEDMNKRLSIWSVLQRADILAGLSTYSIVLLGTPDGNLSAELPKGAPDKLLFLSPFSGGGNSTTNLTRSQTVSTAIDATIKEYETNVSSPRFGLPKFYELRRLDVQTPELQKPVHWSRVIHIAENTLDNEVFGTPTLESVWNLLHALHKVTDGGAEAFWLRANAGLHANMDKDVSFGNDPNLRQKELDAFAKQIEDYKHNITRVLRTRGVDINQLGSDVADITGPADAILTQIAGTTGIPKRILTGSEAGHLASTQDQENWNTQVNDRRTGYAGPMIVRRFVDRLIEYGYLPTPKQYEVGWPTDNDLDEMEKADYANKLATVNKTQGERVFESDYLREIFDLEPLDEYEPMPGATQPGTNPDGTPIDPNAAEGTPAPGKKPVPGDQIQGSNKLRAAGDFIGHDFHGNQWSGPEGVDTHPYAVTQNKAFGKGLGRGGRGAVHVEEIKSVHKNKGEAKKAAQELVDKTSDRAYVHNRATGKVFHAVYPKTNKYLEGMRALEAAIEAGDLEQVDVILGIRAAGDNPGHEFHGNQWTMPDVQQDPLPGGKYYYHATPAKNLKSIAEQGLKAGDNGLSVAPHLDSAMQWSQGAGRGEETALLRMPRRGMHMTNSEDPEYSENEYNEHDPTAENATYSDVPASKLEVHVDGSWKPLTNLFK